MTFNKDKLIEVLDKFGRGSKIKPMTNFNEVNEISITIDSENEYVIELRNKHDSVSEYINKTNQK